MVRTIVGVVVGYIAMFVLIFLVFTTEYKLLGPDHAFRPRSYESSHRWIAIAFAVNFVVAIIGGFICAAIAKSGKAPVALAIVVFVLGLLLAIPSLMVSRANATRPSGDVPMFEAMSKAQQPRWVPFTFPIVGAVGVLVGGKLRRRS
jgi:quinol-cytochrome oxidoreductase complex cytochrome b subunit